MMTKSRVIGYVDVNKILFIFSLKTSSVKSMCRSLVGIEFQNAGPDEQKARIPIVTVDVLGSRKCRTSAERSSDRRS